VILMAKRSKAGADVPGIYVKPPRGEALEQSKLPEPPLSERLAELSEWLSEWSTIDDADIARDARHALMDLRMVEQLLDLAPLPRAKSERLVDISMRLGETVERMQVRTLDREVRNGRKVELNAEN